jgi:lysozyme family protein
MRPFWRDYFALLMEFEGVSYECDPDDPGGATKFGVDQRSHPSVNIKALTKSAAEKIYLAEFAKSFAAELSEPLSYAYFDLAVNAGEKQAAKCLQRALGVEVDGQIGTVTRAALKNRISSGELGKLLLKFSNYRERFYQDLAYTRPVMNKFLSGWLRRAKAMHTWAATRLEVC